MKIELKSNNKLILTITLIFTIFVTIATIVYIFAICLDIWNARRCWQGVFIFVVFEIIAVTVVLVIKFCNWKRYIFSKESIEVYKKDKLINKVSIVDIKNINYVRGKWWSPILEFCSGCVYNTWTLDIELTEGKKLHFGYFSKKDAKRLKDELYGDLITIS